MPARRSQSCVSHQCNSLRSFALFSHQQADKHPDRALGSHVSFKHWHRTPPPLFLAFAFPRHDEYGELMTSSHFPLTKGKWCGNISSRRARQHHTHGNPLTETYSPHPFFGWGETPFVPRITELSSACNPPLHISPFPTVSHRCAVGCRMRLRAVMLVHPTPFIGTCQRSVSSLP